MGMKIFCSGVRISLRRWKPKSSRREWRRAGRENKTPVCARAESLYRIQIPVHPLNSSTAERIRGARRGVFRESRTRYFAGGFPYAFLASRLCSTWGGTSNQRQAKKTKKKNKSPSDFFFCKWITRVSWGPGTWKSENTCFYILNRLITQFSKPYRPQSK